MIDRTNRLLAVWLGAGLVGGALFLAGCGSHSLNPTAPSSETAGSLEWGIKGTPALYRAVDAQEAVSPILLSRRDVVGTSAGLDAAGKGIVRVYVERADVSGLPERVNGMRVERVVTGRFHAWALTGEFRPLRLGVSLGNENESGAIACVVERHGKQYLLGAGHVLARENQARIGEAIVQPGVPKADARNRAATPPGAAVARLAEFQRVYYDGKTPNFMDAAIAEITLPSLQVRCNTPRGFYGAPGSNPITGSLGMRVMKLGPTTELTHGFVTGVNAKVKVDYASGTALLVGQLETSGSFGDFGDSGALVLTDDGRKRPVGMIVGGNASGAAIATPIGRILSRFDATICRGDDDR